MYENFAIFKYKKSMQVTDLRLLVVKETACAVCLLRLAFTM